MDSNSTVGQLSAWASHYNGCIDAEHNCGICADYAAKAMLEAMAMPQSEPPALCAECNQVASHQNHWAPFGWHNFEAAAAPKPAPPYSTCGECTFDPEPAPANLRYCGTCNLRRYFRDGQCEMCGWREENKMETFSEWWEREGRGYLMALEESHQEGYVAERAWNAALASRKPAPACEAPPLTDEIVGRAAYEYWRKALLARHPASAISSVVTPPEWEKANGSTRDMFILAARGALAASVPPPRSL